MKFNQFATVIFDCDGVILDSNKIKTKAFYETALPYGVDAANALINHHKAHGGISRYKKFEYFLKEIVGTKVEKGSFAMLLDNYAREVRQGLISCQISPGLEHLRQVTQSRWLIVSGGDQNELRDIFAQREIAGIFNGGIFGSPDTKDTILSRELENGNIELPALFVGDSKYDYQAARKADLDFIFAHQWTEVSDWREYCVEHSIDCIKNISYLNDSFK